MLYEQTSYARNLTVGEVRKHGAVSSTTSLLLLLFLSFKCILTLITTCVFHVCLFIPAFLKSNACPKNSIVGRHSVVGIATRYGPDGPGIESRKGRDFLHPSRATLGLTRSPTQGLPGHSSEQVSKLTKE
jgi:hypothetical protein